MKLFDALQARHFCAPLARVVAGQGQSLKRLHAGMSPRTVRLREGEASFETHRVSLLNSVERWLLFGVAHYRRAMDMFIPSCAPWAHVTLYYASFFGANAILGLFGGWVAGGRLGVVDVEHGVQGQQVLRIRRPPRGRLVGPTGYEGSHRVFWDFFYEGCLQLTGWVPPSLLPVLSPVNNVRAWQSDARNEVNYDTFHAHEAALGLHKTFKAKKLRASLTGPLRQQLEVTESMLKLAVHYAGDFGVHSWALDRFGIPGTRAQVIRKLVSAQPPGLVMQSVLQDLLA
jgi:hypothetical protein